MARTSNQRYMRATSLIPAAYMRWQKSEAGTPEARRYHRHYTRLVIYLGKMVADEAQRPAFL